VECVQRRGITHKGGKKKISNLSATVLAKGSFVVCVPGLGHDFAEMMGLGDLPCCTCPTRQRVFGRVRAKAGAEYKKAVGRRDAIISDHSCRLVVCVPRLGQSLAEAVEGEMRHAAHVAKWCLVECAQAGDMGHRDGRKGI
jgi:hypothetical protein